MSARGKFIAFVGMMGAGKSTLTKLLAQQLNAEMFIEPEAEHWPLPPDEPWENHVYTLETWVRNTNHENFVLANAAAEKGANAISDGGFFLLNRDLMGTECCDWYFSHLSTDEYEKLHTQALADWNAAPTPDILILLAPTKSTWLNFLQARGREMDENADMIKNYEDIQQQIASAATNFANARGVSLVRFAPSNVSAKQNLKALLAILTPLP